MLFDFLTQLNYTLNYTHLKNISLFLFLLFAISSFGQIKRYTVTGKVIDKEKLAVIGASTVLLNPVDSVMMGFGNTNEDGIFTIKNVKPADLVFQVTYIGLGTMQKKLTIGGDVAIIDLGEILMTDDETLLKEVIIKGDFIPIKIKKDTVEYNADAFRVRPNASVEELLKKLPGVEVNDDGSVTAQGEAVQRVTVDGKKFFGNDVTMATKNIPADAVKKVQFIDKKSDKAEFSGISDGTTEKVMNLELKDNKKVGNFGNVYAGYGSDKRYEAGGSFNKFSGGFQLGSVLKLNNVSRNGVSSSEFNALTGSSGGGRGGFGGGNVPSGLSGSSSGQVESATGGLNIYKEFSKKTNLTVSYFLNGLEQSLIEGSNRQNFLGDKTFTSINNTNSLTNNIGHTFNTNFQTKPDSFHRVDIEASYVLRDNENKKTINSENLGANREKINENKQDDARNTEQGNLNVRGTITRRLKKPGRILSLTGNYANNNNEQDYFIQSFRVLTRSRDTLLQNQLSNNGSNNYNLNLEYKEPLGKRNYLGLEIQRRNNKSDQDKEFYDINPLTRIEDLNETLTNLFRNDISYNRATVQYTKDADDFSINVDLGAQRSRLLSNNNRPGFEAIDKSYNYLLPGVRIDWSKYNLRFRYSKSVNEPSSTQLQSIVDNSDPLNVYIGNPGLRPESNHDFNLRYFFFDQFNFRNMFAFVNYRLTTDNIVTAQSINQDLARQSSPLNLGNNHNVSFTLAYGTPIKPLNLKSRFNTRINYTKGLNFINLKENDVTTLGPGFGVELENTNNEVVSVVASYNYTNSQNKYSVNTQNNTTFSVNNLRSNIIVLMGKGFSFTGDINHNIYSKEQFGEENTLTLANVGLAKTFMKDRLTLAFRVDDLLNVGQGINRNATPTYLEEVTTNAIGRYGMLTATYKLNAFSGRPAGPQIMIR